MWKGAAFRVQLGLQREREVPNMTRHCHPHEVLRRPQAEYLLARLVEERHVGSSANRPPTLLDCGNPSRVGAASSASSQICSRSCTLPSTALSADRHQALVRSTLALMFQLKMLKIQSMRGRGSGEGLDNHSG